MDSGEVVVTGTKEDPPRFDTCVYSSFSGGGGELYARINGSESCRGRSSDVKRNTEETLDVGSGTDAAFERSNEREVRGGVTVVSITGGGDELPGIVRYALTASRICSSAAGKSLKYAKK